MNALKDKRVLGLFLITGLLVVGAVITSILVAKNAVTLKNRAAEVVQCKPSLIRCAPVVGATTTSYKVKLLDQNGVPFPDDKVSFSGIHGDLTYIPTDVNEPVGHYSCKIVALDENGEEDPTCSKTGTSGSICTRFTPSTTPGDTTPPVGGGACTCGPNDIDCQSKKVEKFPGPDGPGYVEIDPIFKGPACFNCKTITVFKDGKEFKTKDCSQKLDGSLLDDPIVLNQANGQQCATYTMEIKGTDDKAAPMSCGSCSSKVCCPACAKPEVVPNQGSNGLPAKIGCGTQCNISFAQECHQVGEPIEIVIENSGYHCLSIPGVGVKCGNYTKGQRVTVPPIQNGGSSEISIGCLSDPESPSIENSDFLCTYRFPITCTQPSGTVPSIPVTPQTTPSVTPSVTPPLRMCIPLRPRLRVDCSDPQDPRLCQ